MGRLVRVALASIFLLTSVACGWTEDVEPRIAGGGSEIGNEEPTPPSGPTVPQTPPPVEPPAIAAYAVRWNPSVSPGVMGYELTIRNAVTGSARTVDIPLVAAASAGGNVLRFEVNLETSHNHLLTLRAYDGSTKSPPSNEILVRAQALIASAMAGMPSAALAGDASSDSWTNTTPSTSFASTSSASGDSVVDATASADAAARDADELAASNETLASIAFMGEGDHLEGLVEGASGVLLDGFDANASGGTLAAWLRPLLDDSLRHVVVSLAAGADAGSDLLELAIVDAGDLELTLRDDSGRVGHQVRFAAALQADVWQHVALVFDPLAARPFTLLVDGVAVPDDGTTLGTLGATVSGGVLRIGAGLEGESFSGRIGHVALWSRAVETDELFFASDRGHALDLRSDAMGTGLAHYWRLGEGDGEVELDLAGTEMPIDLVAVGGVLAAVEDAPAPLE